ncbi:hypothetical protein IU438_13125 [Nocardia cyriacigeorgica]|uniref:hypothetical protein n=1 Tax=Nocardia cyriacigeorgica TaxID=135487 RepID=UPI0018958AFC|nr:hypothetical protein [Nocardia cyriacigeorgica]MBF6396736.1 hypothetical protein [Nocardia cyriacigeorgica]MBF6402368.1 hypothetical protein [Nocardia cyriacigeorgica]
MSTDNSAERDGTSRTQVDAADLRRLLDADPNSCLLLVEGRIQLHTGPVDDRDGMVVVTRADLAEHIGAQPEEAQLHTQAALLDDKIRLLGA